MRTNAVPAIVIVAMFLTGAPAKAHDPAEASYLGNEGVLVANADSKVLFDAFYSDSYGAYALVSPETAKAMLEGAPPFDGVDAIFVSHIHGDHFSAAPTIDYLRAHSDVRLYAPQQVKAAILAAGVGVEDPLMARIIGIDMDSGDAPRALSENGLAIDVYAIPHAGGERTADIQNIAFRVTLNNTATIMHFGDADPADEWFAPYQTDFDRRKINAAFPPYWFLSDPEGRQVLERRIKADHVIGIHVPAEAIGKGDVWRADLGGDLFTDPGETRTIGRDR